MNDLEELLQKTLQKAASNFDKAVKDLTEAANAISHAVINQTKTRARIVLEKVKSGDGVLGWISLSRNTYFRLTINFGQLNQDIVFFEVPPSGYPILTAQSLSLMEEDVYERTLQDKQSITNFFKEMVSDPESELVMRLLQLMREPPEKPSKSEDDDVSF